MTDECEYDVVIVGAGVAGAMVAKRVTEGTEKRVLILEAGKGSGMTPEGYRSYVDHYYSSNAKVPNSPYPDNKNAPSANVLHLSDHDKSYLVQKGPFPFLSDYERARGGTTLHWLGTCLRMLPNDFQMQSKYGVAVDWPISYDELEPYYRHAEFEIGVSGDVVDQAYPGTGPDNRGYDPERFFGEGYEYPMEKIPQSYLDLRIAAAVEGLQVQIPGQSDPIDIFVASTPQGRNSVPRNGYEPVGMVGEPETGQRCEGNSSCTPICPVQAKYNALKTLNQIPADQLTILDQCVASSILRDTDTNLINGIEYKHYEDPDSPNHTTHVARGKIYVLAAHAIENAKLLLASDVANHSDQVGRNLMDHLVLLTWGLMPDNVGSFRGPGSTSGIPVFRDGDFRSDHSAFRVEIGNWGWNWAAGAPVTDVQHLVDTENLFGAQLRHRLAETVPRQFRIGWEVEQLPDAENRVTIDDQLVDRLGNHRPVIQYSLSDPERAAAAAAKRISDQLFEYAGIEGHTAYDPQAPGYFTYPEDSGSASGYVVNGAGHLVGTHRMGFTRDDSVVDARQRSWDHHNLYLVGCGNMPTLGTSNPTLTAAALSLWAGDNILEDLD